MFEKVDVMIQGDHLNMAVIFDTLSNITYSVYMCTVACTGQVILYKVPEKHGHVFNWSPALYLQFWSMHF